MLRCKIRQVKKGWRMSSIGFHDTSFDTKPRVIEDRYKRYARNHASYLEQKNGPLNIDYNVKATGPIWNCGKPLPFDARLRLEAEARDGSAYLDSLYYDPDQPRLVETVRDQSENMIEEFIEIEKKALATPRGDLKSLFFRITDDSSELKTQEISNKLYDLVPLSNLNITVHQNPEASNKFMVYIFDEQQKLEVEIMRKIIEQVYSTASGFKLVQNSEAIKANDKYLKSEKYNQIKKKTAKLVSCFKCVPKKGYRKKHIETWVSKILQERFLGEIYIDYNYEGSFVEHAEINVVFNDEEQHSIFNDEITKIKEKKDYHTSPCFKPHPNSPEYFQSWSAIYDKTTSYLNGTYLTPNDLRKEQQKQAMIKLESWNSHIKDALDNYDEHLVDIVNTSIEHILKREEIYFGLDLDHTKVKPKFREILSKNLKNMISSINGVVFVTVLEETEFMVTVEPNATNLLLALDGRVIKDCLPIEIDEIASKFNNVGSLVQAFGSIEIITALKADVEDIL